MISDCITRNDLADFLGVPRSVFARILYHPGVDSHYTSFEIPKKDGTARVIHAPTHELSVIQRKLANELWKQQVGLWEKQGKRPQISHAFEKGKSIITNAKIHRNKRYVFNIDLENFFDSFHFGRVQGYFLKNRYWLIVKSN